MFKNSTFILIVILLVSFFLPLKVAPIIIMILLVFLIFCYKKIDFREALYNQKYFFIYFGILVVGGIKAMFIDIYLNQVEQSLSFIAFPIISGLFQFLNLKEFKRIKLIYIIVSNIALFICLSLAFRDYYTTGYYILTNPNSIEDRNRFLYHEFTQYIGFHAVYLSFYLSISFVFLVEYVKSKRKKIFYYLPFVLFNLLGVILCKSAILYFCMAMYLIYTIYQEIKIKFIWRTLLSSILFLGVFFLIKNKVISFEFSFTIEEILKTPSMINTRLAKWYSGIMIWKNHLLFGVGTGNSDYFLLKYYEKIDFFEGIKYKYNTHNQYIGILLRNGLIGLSAFCLLFYNSIKKSLKSKNIQAIFFIIFTLLFSITESTFEVQRGIIFISFFLVFFNSENILYTSVHNKR